MKTCGQCKRWEVVSGIDYIGKCRIACDLPAWIAEDSPFFTNSESGELLRIIPKDRTLADRCKCFEPTEPKEDECSSNK